MTTESDNRGHSTLAENMWAQLVLFAAVAVIVIVLASRYVW
jgi:membrane protein implicated in regulation of membrane protease activity